MRYVKIFLCIQALICVVTGIKVNMQGRLNLGKEVVESLTYYLGKNVLSGRRFLNPPPVEDTTTLAVRTALICKDLDFCQYDLQNFLNEYIIILAHAAASILGSSNTDFNNETYEEHLKESMEHIRKILENANAKVDKETEDYYWIHVIKRINAKFQKLTDDINPHTETESFSNEKHKIVPMDLRHKIVIVTAFIERKYIRKLCSDYNICSKSHQCTKALNKMLIHFKTLPEDRIRLFVKYFYEALFDSPFYSHLSQTTGHEFQIILNDMSYANNTPTKEIMLAVLRTVEARMTMIQLNKGIVVVHEILIAHTILSDVDHMFSNDTNAFTMFLNKFYDWLASDVHLQKHIRTVLSDISKQISSSEEDLAEKLIDEVTVFLEMTVNATQK